MLHSIYKSSKIEFLSLYYLKDTEGFDPPDFFQFLRNSDSLLGLYLYYSNPNFKLDLILQELCLNKTLQILYLGLMKLNNFSSNLVNLINFNKAISTLILTDFQWKIDASFIEAVLKSQSLFYLILDHVKIEDDLVLKLTESNLKGVNVDSICINRSTKDLIYKKIPRIKYSTDFLHYEQYLRPIN